LKAIYGSDVQIFLPDDFVKSYQSLGQFGKKSASAITLVRIVRFAGTQVL